MKVEDKKLVYHNSTCKLYKTLMTQNLTKYCTRQMLNDAPPLLNYEVFLATTRDDTPIEYVLYDDNGYPVEASNTFDGLASLIDMIRLSMLCEE